MFGERENLNPPNSTFANKNYMNTFSVGDKKCPQLKIKGLKYTIVKTFQIFCAT